MQAKRKDSVKVHYTGTLDDGTVFDSSRDGEPLEFCVGSGQVIRGFDEAVVDMSSGETKTVRVSAPDAYGLRNEDLVATVNRSKFPAGMELTPGLHLQMKKPDGMILNVLVTRIAEDEVTLDANHPFAGKDLTFEIEVLEINRHEE